MRPISRRDFLKLGGLALGALAFSPLLSTRSGFDDSPLVRVATESVSVYKEPSDESAITGTWYRDELIHVYGEVKGVNGEPKYNPIWYRVWGGYLHRARLQKVKVIYNKPLDLIPEGTRQLVEVTVPFTQPWRSTGQTPSRKGMTGLPGIASSTNWTATSGTLHALSTCAQFPMMNLVRFPPKCRSIKNASKST
jgi:hypothetical protein